MDYSVIYWHWEYRKKRRLDGGEISCNMWAFFWACKATVGVRMELGRKITEKTKAVNVTRVSTGARGKQAQFETTQRNCALKETL